MKQKNRPPIWTDRLIEFLCSRDLQEEILGDLHEFYHSKSNEPQWKKQIIYYFHVLHFLRPFAIKKPSWSALKTLNMLRNHLLISRRIIRSNKSFSAINILGLSISMSVGILMILFLNEVTSFDDFHKNKEEIYRITTKRVQGAKGNEVDLATASYFIGRHAQEASPGIEKVAFVASTNLQGKLQANEKSIPITGRYVSDAFFDVFSFSLQEGTRSQLGAPGSIVLSASVAENIFGDEIALGQSVSIHQNETQKVFLVTGIIEDPPRNSHIQFDILLPIPVGDSSSMVGAQSGNDPDDTGAFYVYLLLHENASDREVESVLNAGIGRHNRSLENPVSHHLQPMHTFVTSDIYYNELGPRFPRKRVLIMIGLTILILLAACINYTNLSLARSTRRSMELGIKKVSGARRVDIFTQFLVEAILLALLSSIVAFGIFLLSKEHSLHVLSLAMQGQDVFALNIQWYHIIYFLVFTILIGSAAGFLPGFLFSKLQAKTLFDGIERTHVLSGSKLNGVLTAFQFMMSIGLIMGSVMIHKQYKFSLNYDLGYDTENMVHIPIHGDYIDRLENAYSSIPEVIETSKSSMVLGVGGDGLGIGMAQVPGMEAPTPSLLSYVDQNFLSFHDFEVLAGTPFKNTAANNVATPSMIVNESFIQAMNFASNQSAIGKVATLNGQEMIIEGVVNDFIGINLTKKLFDPFAFILSSDSDQFQSLAVKFKSSNLSDLILALKGAYTDLDPVYPFEFNFYDDQIEYTYRQQKVTLHIISFLALVAVIISMLGMLGMTLFTTERRSKEISIRKILGAGLVNLVLSLSKGFLTRIIISTLIALPLTLYLIDRWVLRDFLYRTKMGLLEISSGVILLLIIGIATIAWHVRLAATRNPAEILKEN